MKKERVAYFFSLQSKILLLSLFFILFLPNFGFVTNSTNSVTVVTAKPNILNSITNSTSQTLSINMSTFLGGNGLDLSNDIAVDSTGNIYVTGSTNSTDFPLKNAFEQTAPQGENAFITKFSSKGSLIFSTYFGGSGDESGTKICADTNGNSYIIGTTTSNDLPIKNAYQSVLKGTNDVFIAKFNSTGGLLFSTYFGGSDADTGNGIAIDILNNIYISGNTLSSDFPVLNSFDSTLRGYEDSFVAKFNNTGNLEWSTLIGGTSIDNNYGLAVDTYGNSFITGFTLSNDFQTFNAYKTTFSGEADAFITKIDTNGSLVFSTYFGGENDTIGMAIATDLQGNSYITGNTMSPNLPTKNAYDSTYNGLGFSGDAFVSKFSENGSLVFSTYLGGSAMDYGNGIAVDNNGSVFVTGPTFSYNFPLKNPLKSKNEGTVSSFITQFSSSGEMLLSTYFGGKSVDDSTSIAVDNIGNVYITGFTLSTDFPVVNAYVNKMCGQICSFITKFSLVPYQQKQGHSTPDFIALDLFIIPIFVYFKKQKRNQKLK